MKKGNKKKRCCRADATNGIMLALKTNIGDGRQRAEEQMGNKNKNTTLKPFGKRPAKIDLPNVPHDFVDKTQGFLVFGEHCMMFTGRFGKILSFRAEATGRGRGG